MSEDEGGNSSDDSEAPHNEADHNPPQSPLIPVADPGGGKGGANEPPFGLHLILRSTDDKLNGTPLSGYRTKKTAVMAHLRML